VSSMLLTPTIGEIMYDILLVLELNARDCVGTKLDYLASLNHSIVIAKVCIDIRERGLPNHELVPSYMT